MKRELRWHGMRRARVARDLTLKFRDDVLRQVEDTLDTGNYGGVPIQQTLAAIINSLLYIAAMLSYATGARQDEFMEHSGTMYRAASEDKPMLDAIMKRHERLREGIDGRNRHDH